VSGGKPPYILALTDAKSGDTIDGDVVQIGGFGARGLVLAVTDTIGKVASARFSVGAQGRAARRHRSARDIGCHARRSGSHRGGGGR
jgi:hypothetical protein